MAKITPSCKHTQPPKIAQTHTRTRAHARAVYRVNTSSLLCRFPSTQPGLLLYQAYTKLPL